MATSKIPMDPLLNKINFLHIPSAKMSNTNNPLAIADKMVARNGTDVCYVSIGGVGGYVAYAPIGYTMYTILHVDDTVTIRAVDYGSGNFYTNGKARHGAWCGWKRATMSSV